MIKRIFQPLAMLRALLAFCLLGAGVASQAATITWQSASNITLNSFGQLSGTPGSTTDPYLGGTTKYAYTWGTSSPYNAVPGELLFVKTNIVNGSTPEGNLTVSGFSGIAPEGSFFGVYPSLPSNYKTCVANAATNSSGAMCTNTLGNLTIGRSYAVQVWVNDSTGATRTNLYATVANTAGNGGAGVDLLYNNGYGNYLTSGGAVGQCVVGTFTADATSQEFTMEGKVLSGSGASTILNAIQLRDLTPSAASAPVFNNPVPGNNYMGAQNILVVGESGSTVYYTTDGSTPTTSSPSGAAGSGYAFVSIPAGATTTIKAVSDATAKFKTVSAETDATYTTTASGTATWITAGGGVFSNVVNWASFVPFGPDTIADFSTVSLTGTAWVTNEVTRTNGSLLFDDQSGNHNAWGLTNNTINLNNNLITPVISNNVPVTIRSTLQGVHGFVKTGSGKLTVYSAYTLAGSGAGYVENGMLELGASTLGGVPAIYLGTANSGSATTTFRLAPVTTSNGNAGLFPSMIISSAAPNSTAVIDGNPNSITNWGNLNVPIVLQGGRSVTFTNSSSFFYRLQRNISGNGDVIVAAPNYASRIVLNPTNSTTGIPLPINNTWVGNLRITSGAVQITDGLGGTGGRDAIPDTADVIMSANTIMAFSGNETFGALNGDAGSIVGETYSTDGTTINMTLGANNSNGVFNGTIRLSDAGAYANANMPLQITKIGTGTQTFNGACSNTAPTLVGGGALMINSAYFAPAVTVSNSATLGGTGILASNVTVQAGGTLSPGTNLIGTLTINNNLTLAGNLFIKVDKALSPLQTNDSVTVSGALTNTGVGTLTMTNLNLGQPFAAGDKFTIFSQPLVNGGNMNISPASPGTGLAWVNNLAVDGTLSVIELPPTLSSLVISPAGTMNPAFATNNLGYTATNTYVNNPVTVTAYAADPGSTLQLSLNGGAYGPLTSGVASSPQTLGLPNNTVAVKVTSASALTNQTYTVNVTLQPSLTPAQMTSTASGSTLTLTWPADHLGWHLEAQTNTLDTGLTTGGWVVIPGTDLVTQTNISIIQNNPAVFFRMTYP